MKKILILLTTILKLIQLAEKREHINLISIIDAGSTGSSILVFQYNKSKSNLNSLELLNDPNKIKPPFTFFTPLIFQTDNSKGHNATRNPLLRKKLRNVIQSLFEELKSAILSKNSMVMKCDIYLKATAGFRTSLNTEMQNKLLEQILFELKHRFSELKKEMDKENSFFYFDDNEIEVEVISGSKEGFYSLVALDFEAMHYNYNLLHSDVGKNGKEIKRERIGIMEMGGASLQVAFKVPNSLYFNEYYKDIKYTQNKEKKQTSGKLKSKEYLKEMFRAKGCEFFEYSISKRVISELLVIPSFSSKKRFKSSHNDLSKSSTDHSNSEKIKIIENTNDVSLLERTAFVKKLYISEKQTVLSCSFDGLGFVSAHKRFLSSFKYMNNDFKNVLSSSNRAENEKGKEEEESSVVKVPCYNNGIVIKESGNIFEGSFDSELCEKVLKEAFFDKFNNHKNEFELIKYSLGRIFDLHNSNEKNIFNFYGVAKLKFEAEFFMAQNNSFDILNSREIGDEFCRMSWEKLRTNYPKEIESFLETRCFALFYFNELLSDMLKFDSEKTHFRYGLGFEEEVGERDVKWAEGAAIMEI